MSSMKFQRVNLVTHLHLHVSNINKHRKEYCCHLSRMTQQLPGLYIYHLLYSFCFVICIGAFPKYDS
jgi:hypothetical protein